MKQPSGRSTLKAASTIVFCSERGIDNRPRPLITASTSPVVIHRDVLEVAGVTIDHADEGELPLQVLVQFRIQFDDKQLLGCDLRVEQCAREHAGARAEFDDALRARRQLAHHEAGQLCPGW